MQQTQCWGPTFFSLKTVHSSSHHCLSLSFLVLICLSGSPLASGCSPTFCLSLLPGVSAARLYVLLCYGWSSFVIYALLLLAFACLSASPMCSLFTEFRTAYFALSSSFSLKQNSASLDTVGSPERLSGCQVLWG